MTLLRSLLLAVAVFVASCANAPTEQAPPDWRLVSATETADETHLIVTVPLEAPEALARTARRLEADHPIALVAEWPLNAIEIHCFVFRVTGQADPAQVAERLNASDAVSGAQQMQVFRVMAGLYSDEHVGLQASLEAINAMNAHALATGAGVRVAVVDTGVEVEHPDLVARVAMARDFIGDKPAPPPGELHGTAMAGVILADADNDTGIVGVAPDARLVALRGCWQDRSVGRCSSFSLARAMNFAVANDVDVLNLSLAGPFDPLLAQLIEAALTRGMVVVAAQGSPGTGAFPASMEGVIAAGATRSDPTGPVPAPALDVLTTAPGGGYDFASGSSIAAAHVSGVAALLLQRAPDLSPGDIRDAMTGSVRSRNGPNGSVLDACLALVSVLNEDPAARC